MLFNKFVNGSVSAKDNKIPFLVETNQRYDFYCDYKSIACCPNKLLRYSLMIYGFVPNSTPSKKCMTILKWIHRLLILISLSMGFYSVEGITNTNHGSTYLTVILDIVYPLFYCVSLPYFTQSDHFWKICSIRGFVMTKYAQTHISIFLLFGLIVSLSMATWQKWIWKEEHLEDGVYNAAFALWLVFYITFILRIYTLFLCTITFWIASRFHQRQIKIYLENICNGNFNASSLNGSSLNSTNDQQANYIFNTLVSIKADMNYTNKQVQGYLSVFLITILISLIVLVTGIFLSFIQIKVFINNSSDLFLMGAVAMYILIIAAQTTQKFADINEELKNFHHQQIAFANWKPQEVMVFLLYCGKEQDGFSLFGVVLNYGRVMRFFIILMSSFLSTFGVKFYS